MLCLVSIFFYTLVARFSEEIFLHLMLVLVRSFLTPLRVCLVRFLSYTPDASFREEFLLHS